MTTEEELREQVEDLEGRLSSIVSLRDLTIRNLRERVAELEAALEPIARCASHMPAIVEGVSRLADAGPAFLTSSEGIDYVVTFAHLRACRDARAAVPAIADQYAKICADISSRAPAPRSGGNEYRHGWVDGARECARRIAESARSR